MLNVVLALIASTSILAGTAAAQNDGVCVGPAWVAGKATSIRDGPDFTVYTVKATAGPVNIYVGCCSEVSAAPKTEFTRIDGIRVQRASRPEGFAGYLVVHRHGDYESQLHFFGAGLMGDDRDRTFFQRVRFGSVAASRCKKK